MGYCFQVKVSSWFNCTVLGPWAAVQYNQLETSCTRVTTALIWKSYCFTSILYHTLSFCTMCMLTSKIAIRAWAMSQPSHGLHHSNVNVSQSQQRGETQLLDSLSALETPPTPPFLLDWVQRSKLIQNGVLLLEFGAQMGFTPSLFYRSQMHHKFATCSQLFFR